MTTTAKYLVKLAELKDDLVDNLKEKGISDIDTSSKFNTLIPKVLAIKPKWREIISSNSPVTITADSENVNVTEYLNTVKSGVPTYITYSVTVNGECNCGSSNGYIHDSFVEHNLFLRKGESLSDYNLLNISGDLGYTLQLDDYKIYFKAHCAGRIGVECSQEGHTIHFSGASITITNLEQCY